jgi:protein-S-isoprenylcysteine O-methyltransferase Ste14
VHALVTSGPYRWIRHPFYAAAALSVTANGLVAANGFLLATGWATVVLMVLRTTKEEQLLVARFGEPCRSYMSRTRRFIPGW